MKIFKSIQVPSQTKVIEDKRSCDICGFESKGYSWYAGVYEVDETEIKVTVRQKEYTIDICPKCFKQKLVPWMQSQGANIEPIDWETEG